jgi:hypothetical protein
MQKILLKDSVGLEGNLLVAQHQGIRGILLKGDCLKQVFGYLIICFPFLFFFLTSTLPFQNSIPPTGH